MLLRFLRLRRKREHRGIRTGLAGRATRPILPLAVRLRLASARSVLLQADLYGLSLGLSLDLSLGLSHSFSVDLGPAFDSNAALRRLRIPQA